MSYKIADKGADKPRTGCGQGVDKVKLKLRSGPVFMGVWCLKMRNSCPRFWELFRNKLIVFEQKKATFSQEMVLFAQGKGVFRNGFLPQMRREDRSFRVFDSCDSWLKNPLMLSFGGSPLLTRGLWQWNHEIHETARTIKTDSCHSCDSWLKRYF